MKSWVAALVGIVLVAIAGCGGSEGAADDGGGGGRDGGGGGTDGALDPDGGGRGGSEDGGSGGGDDGGPPAGRVPVFVAQGMVGRTTLSCDDGRTWVADRAWDREGNDHFCGSTDPIECYADGSSCMMRWSDGSCDTHAPCDCGHSPGFAKGIVYADGAFVGTWGWGWPGSVMRSTNGVDWTVTHDNESFGGIAWGAGRFVIAARDNYHSDDGITWTAGETADFSGPSEPVIWSVRRFGFADHDGGRFVAIASGNTDRDILVSSDGGETWWRPDVVPDGCGAGVDSYGGIVYGNGVIALLGEGSACRSTDGGRTWSMARVVPASSDDILVAYPIFTGTEFWAWSHYEHVMYRSTDAETWEGTPMATPETLGPVARNPETGTLVAANSVWSGYGDLRFLRSTDGSTWEVLADGAFAPSHPIFHIAFGYAEPSAACPAP